MSTAKYIRWFAEIRNEDVASVGGKNASLGEMYQDLTKAGVKIPNGFAITADAYWRVVKTGGIIDQIKYALADLDKTSVANLEGRGKKVRGLILGAGIPDDIWDEISSAYDQLCKEYEVIPMLPSGALPRLKTSPLPLLPASRRPTLTSGDILHSGRPAANVLLLSLQIEQYPTGSTRTSTISRSPFLSAS